MAEILLINPRFEISFWGMEEALPMMGKRANLPVAGLPLLAALTPEPHRVEILDENVEPLDFDRCARFDIIGLTGMSVQRHRMRAILGELKARGCFVVVGGPYVTVQEDYFDDGADAIFIGEAEQTWPQFLQEWTEGRAGYRYEQAEKTDMSTVPTPRYDLVKTDRYAFGSVQFTRGCPFQCEFCDIIVTFGRRPRIKLAERILDELDSLTAEGNRIVFVVDDNLIGNKKAIKPILRAVADWQRQHGYPLTFFTEASLDLADDPELMDLMSQANILFVFIGIETPNEEALRETKKLQNLRSGGTIVEKVHRIQDAGLGVWCGMIMGFDSDGPDIFDIQNAFLRESRIALAMSGMLSAIPKTPLHDRLMREGRLDLDDRSEFGTNIIPLQMSREQLRDGYVRTLVDLYEPHAYFQRLDASFIDGDLRVGRGRSDWWRTHPLNRLAKETLFFAQAFGLFLRLMSRVRDRSLRQLYRRQITRYARHRPNSGDILVYLIHIAIHYHAYCLAQRMDAAAKSNARELVNSF